MSIGSIWELKLGKKEAVQDASFFFSYAKKQVIVCVCRVPQASVAGDGC